MSIYYIVYKTTNIVNNKIYFGKHQQSIAPYQFDGYYGSGQLLSYAIKKYGKSNFIRETLFVFDNENDCLLKEEEVITPHLGKSYCYNMRSGGTGGFEHINNDPKNRKRVSELSSKANKGICRHVPTEKEKEASRQRNLIMKELGIGAYSPEAMKKAVLNRDTSSISKKLSGKNNSAHGSKFYYNLTTKVKKRFKPGDLIPEGWVRSLEYFESKKQTHWYNDGNKNYLLKINDPKIDLLKLIKGRIIYNRVKK